MFRVSRWLPLQVCWPTTQETLLTTAACPCILTFLHAQQYRVTLCAKHPHVEIHTATRYQAAYLLQQSVAVLLRRAVGRARVLFEH